MKSKTAPIFFAILLAGCSTANTSEDGFLGIKRKPDAGYDWKYPGAYFSHEVVWKPGTRVPQFPHTQAADTERQWRADPGYRFQENGGPETAAWTPGLRTSSAAHASADTVEGTWMADAGYALADKSDPASAAWHPGSADPKHPHIHASETEGTWLPDTGFAWANTTPGDLTVVAMQESPLPAASASTGPDGSEVGRVIVNTVAKSCADPQEGDGFWATVGRVGCAVTALATER